MAAVTKALASLAGLIWLTTVAAAEAQDFPLAPPTKSAAEAAGLGRVDAQELSRDYPGKRVLLTARGELIHLDLRPDGTLDYADHKGVTDTGSWSVTARDEGTLCRRFSKQMGGRICDVYFVAPDGVHWFGYDPDTGRWRDTTRAQASK
jgi:hypothetical protein